MMEQRAGLRVDPVLVSAVEDEILPGSRLTSDAFWSALAALVDEFTPRNRELLGERERMQAAIDAWWHSRAGGAGDPIAYRSLLESIGYLVPPAPSVQVRTAGVDREIADVAGAQLVVPVSNARYALNAANARWGSLYDALYGTDAMGDLPASGGYDHERGQRVIAWGRAFLDEVIPLASGSYVDVVSLTVVDGRLTITLADGSSTELKHPDEFLGYQGDPSDPRSAWFTHHGLTIGVIIDRGHPVGATDRAGVSDIVLEAAITTIVDFEDSVAAVDAADKALCYLNWLGLMRGDLTEEVTKSGATFVRSLNDDIDIVDPAGRRLALPGRSLLLVRNVGIHMTTPAVLDVHGDDIHEGLLDALLTVLIAARDIDERGIANSRHGSIYVVKPKLHGPDEVAFACAVFARVEDLLGLPPNTVKIGIMDEERRTSLNLAQCLAVAADRVCFINTGFLDRTGDEIRTSSHAGPMVRKAEMKSQPWIVAYEDQNVDVGLAAGLPGRAQIGKGMWAAPDRMADMLAQKQGHPRAGATCAWVPSPTAATLHATHYHRYDVGGRQRELVAHGARTDLADLLTVPVAADPDWAAEEIEAELDNNLQGVLGYVVRWIDAGVGCSKVPDIHGIGLMEDRATLRISSQHVANWLRHGVVTPDQVDASLRRMAQVVDAQNAGDPLYRPMSPGFDGEAFLAARALVFEGLEQPNGYTEAILHDYRRRAKAHEREHQP